MTNGDKERDNRWAAILEGFKLTQKIKDDEEARQFKSAGAYLAGAIAVVIILLRLDDQAKLDALLLFWVVSIINTFYLVFYTYAGAILLQAVHFQHTIVERAEHFVSEDAAYMDWDGFSFSQNNRHRQAINVAVTSWRAIPLIVGFIAGFMALAKSSTGWELTASIVVLAFAFVIGLGTLIVSLLDARRIWNIVRPNG